MGILFQDNTIFCELKKLCERATYKPENATMVVKKWTKFSGTLGQPMKRSTKEFLTNERACP
jgi:hypothetical protein